MDCVVHVHSLRLQLWPSNYCLLLSSLLNFNSHSRGPGIQSLSFSMLSLTPISHSKWEAFLIFCHFKSWDKAHKAYFSTLIFLCSPYFLHVYMPIIVLLSKWIFRRPATVLSHMHLKWGWMHGSNQTTVTWDKLLPHWVLFKVWTTRQDSKKKL